MYEICIIIIILLILHFLQFNIIKLLIKIEIISYILILNSSLNSFILFSILGLILLKLHCFVIYLKQNI